MPSLGVSYFSTRIIEHVKEDLKDIVKHHCDYVLHTFDELDLFYNLENMKTITALSHKAGLKVYYSPWGLGGVFGGEAYSGFVMKHPDACQVLSTGEPVGNACLRQPKWREYVKTWIEGASYAGGDVVFWDEPHLWIAEWVGRTSRKDEFACRCKVCQADFKKAYGHAYPSTWTPEVEEFRDNTLLDFLTWAAATVKKTRSSMKNAVCLLPHANRWPHPLWEAVAKLPSVDIISTDPYWKERPYTNPKMRPIEGFVDTYAQRLVELAKRSKKQSQGWLQFYAHTKSGENLVWRALEMWERSGVDSIAAWGYQACSSYSLLSAQRPQVLWDRLGKEYAAIKKRNK